jgi:hypothetical protein
MGLTDLFKKAFGSITTSAQNALPVQARIKDYYLKHAYDWDEVNLIGIRNSDTGGSNKFDDLFCLVKDDGVYVYECTTDPGTTWTPEKQQKYGISYAGTVCLGYYKNSHAFGKHHGYTALVQVNAVNDYIDENKNGILDNAEKVNKNILAGYNIHSVGNPEEQGTFVKDIVDVSSAGCTALRNQARFLEMMNVLRSTNKYKQSKRCQFSYLLVDSANFEFYKELLAIVRK